MRPAQSRTGFFAQIESSFTWSYLPILRSSEVIRGHLKLHSLHVHIISLAESFPVHFESVEYGVNYAEFVKHFFDRHHLNGYVRASSISTCTARASNTSKRTARASSNVGSVQYLNKHGKNILNFVDSREVPFVEIFMHELSGPTSSRSEFTFRSSNRDVHEAQSEKFATIIEFKKTK